MQVFKATWGPERPNFGHLNGSCIGQQNHKMYFTGSAWKIMREKTKCTEKEKQWSQARTDRDVISDFIQHIQLFKLL